MNSKKIDLFYKYTYESKEIYTKIKNTNKYISDYIKYYDKILTKNDIVVNDILNSKYSDYLFSMSTKKYFLKSNIITYAEFNENNKNNIFSDEMIYGDTNLGWLILIYMLDIKEINKNIVICRGRPIIPEILVRCGFIPEIMIDGRVDTNIDSKKSKQLMTNTNRNSKNMFIKKYNIIPNEYEVHNTLLLKKYECIVYDVFISIYNIKKYRQLMQTIKQREIINHSLLEDMYRITQYINIGGNLIFYYPCISTSKSLLLLENIFNCFKKITVTPGRTIGILLGFIFVCEGYKPTEKKITQNTKQFCEFIKNIINENLKLTKKITLLRQNVNILLKYAPYCDALECTYLMNRHKSFIIAKTVGLKTIDEPIETKVVTLFKHTITHHENLSIKHKIKCTLLYPPHVQENKEICENEVSGILYDINIYEPEKKEIRKLICYNKRYNKKLKMLDKCKHIKQIDKYIKKHNTLNPIHLSIGVNVLNPIHLFLKNINLSLDDKQTIVYLNDTKKYFETNISSYLNDTKITHFQSNFKQCIKNSKCVIGCCKDINTQTFQKQMLYALHCLNDDDNFILAIELPITTKIVIDLLYIMYCSFKFVYFDFPKKFDNTVYIHFVGHKKSLSTKQVLELDYEQDYTGRSLIQDPYVAEFVDEFIEALNCYIGMMSIHIELKIHLDTLWDELDCKTQLLL